MNRSEAEGGIPGSHFSLVRRLGDFPFAWLWGAGVGC